MTKPSAQRHDWLNICVPLLPLLQESYPSTPPIWFVDSDDPSLAEVLERLEDVRKGSTLVSWPMWIQLHRGLYKIIMSHTLNDPFISYTSTVECS